MSNRSLKNVDEDLNSHNIRVLEEVKTTTTRRRSPAVTASGARRQTVHCPLTGQCYTDRHGKVESVIYRMVREDTWTTEFYTRLTVTRIPSGTTTQTMDPTTRAPDRHPQLHQLGDRHRVPNFRPLKKSCRLDLMEKFYIMYHSSIATIHIRRSFQ